MSDLKQRVEGFRMRLGQHAGLCPDNIPMMSFSAIAAYIKNPHPIGRCFDFPLLDSLLSENEALKQDCREVNEMTYELQYLRDKFAVALAEIEALRKEREPDYFYNFHDWEVTHHDLSSVTEYMDARQILEVGRLYELPRIFVVAVPDEDDCVDELKEFPSREEAEAYLAALPTAPQGGEDA